MRRTGIVLLLLFFSATGYAKTQYVTDILYVTLRAGPGDDFKVLKALKSGTVLEVLEESESGFTRVRLESGEEGWTSAKYLVDDAVGLLKLEKLERENAKLVEENTELKENYSEAKKKVREAEKERKRMESLSQNFETENERLKKISERPLELSSENQMLKSQNTQMQTELATLRQENESFKGKSARNWFLSGAGVLFFGMLLGLILPRLRFKKKSTWV